VSGGRSLSFDTTGAGAATPRPSGPEVRERAATTVPGRPLLSVGTTAAVAGLVLVVLGSTTSDQALCSDHPTQPVVNTGTLYQ
jgi:hypothetical protein